MAYVPKGKPNSVKRYIPKDVSINRVPAKILSGIELHEKFKEVEAMSDMDKEKVLRCFGEFQSYEVIKHQLDVSSPLFDVQMIEMLCHSSAYKLRVMYHRNRYLNKVKDVAISHKRIRIDDLDYLRQRFTAQIELLDDNDPEHRKEFRYMANGLAQILSQAQDEIEGKGININVGLGGFGMEEMDGKSDEELINRREELLKKASRAIGGRIETRPGLCAPDGGGITDITGRGTSGDNANPADALPAQAGQSS